MSKMDPVGGNYQLYSIFGSVIDSDVVKAYEALLESDQIFLSSLSSVEVQYIFALLSMLAPNEDSRLANFGRSSAQEEKRMHKKSHGGMGVKSSVKRRSQPASKGMTILSKNIIKKVSHNLVIVYYMHIFTLIL